MIEYFNISGNPILDGIIWFCIGAYLFVMLVALFFIVYDSIVGIKKTIKQKRREEKNYYNDDNDCDEW